MIIKRIKLENFRRFQSLDLEFPENVIGIIGKNGSGKSSLIEAVGWALYGTRISRTDKQEIRSQFATESSVCRVELDFVYGEQEYRVLRKIKGKNATTEAAIYRSGAGAPEAVQERGVNEFLENLLKLDYRSFLVSVYARQKELAALSNMQPEERRRSINRLIGIDEIDAGREKVRRDRNDRQKFLEGMRHSRLDMSVLQSRQRALLEQLADREQELQHLSRKVLQKRKALENKKIAFEALSNLRDQHNHLKTRLIKDQAATTENENAVHRLRNELAVVESAEKELAEILPQVVEFESIKAKKEELDRLALARTKQEGFEQNRQQLNEQITSILDREQIFTKALMEYETLALQIEESSSCIATVEMSLSDLRKQHNEFSGQRTGAESNGREWTAKLNTLQQLGPEGSCPTCTQPLKEHYEQALREIQEKLDGLRQEYKTAKQQEATLMKGVQEREIELQKFRRQKEVLLQKQAGLKETKKHYTLLLTEKESVHLKWQVNQKQLAELGEIHYDGRRHRDCAEKYEETQKWLQKAAQLQERVARRSTIEDELARVKKNISEIEMEILYTKNAQEALGFKEEEFQNAKIDIEQETRAVDALRDALSVCRETTAGVKRETETVGETILEQLQKEEQIKKLEEDIYYLDALDLHLGRFRLELAGRIRPMLAHRASELLALTSKNRYQMVDLDQDYNISIYDGNSSFGVDRFSGGEQDLVNLCLRIAVSQIVAERSGGYPINFIVLDEVFASQDEERKQCILEALSQLSSQFRQIFMITHVEAIKDVLPVILEVRFLDQEKSEAMWA
jgi:DNA repair protein SbcC/Rad50